ncbi:MAG: ATP synthase F1 subunit delta [Calditrichaeota bacterium]|nr:ATP synthase F1 subunit delta [Calditrichota bacterium]
MTGGLAKRYIQPLFEVARQKDMLDTVEADLLSITETLQSSPELKKLLFNPAESRAAKRKMLEGIFPGVSPYTMNFLRLLVDKNRADVLLTAHKLYVQLLNAQRGVTVGVVESAAPLSEDDFAGLLISLSERFKGALKLERRIDPALLGGVRVRIGNTVLDNSLQNKLTRLRSVFLRE